MMLYLMLSIIVVSIDVLLSIKIKYIMYGMVTQAVLCIESGAALSRAGQTSNCLTRSSHVSALFCCHIPSGCLYAYILLTKKTELFFSLPLLAVLFLRSFIEYLLFVICHLSVACAFVVLRSSAVQCEWLLLVAGLLVITVPAFTGLDTSKDGVTSKQGINKNINWPSAKGGGHEGISSRTAWNNEPTSAPHLQFISIQISKEWIGMRIR